MPEWIHNRAQHIQAKNPSMPESESWAIATQQAHATGKSPKGYGTTEGRHEAKEKYDTPSDDKKTADPGGVGKRLEKGASIFRALAPAVVQDQDDRFRQILREELANTSQQHSPQHPQHPHHPHVQHVHQQPSLNTKTAGLIQYPFSLALIEGFSDELQKIAGLTLNNVAPKPTVSSQITSSIPRNTMSAKKPSYSNPSYAPGGNHPDSPPSMMQTTQPVLSPPPVRG